MFRRFWHRISFNGLSDLPEETALLQYREIVLMNRLTTFVVLLLLLYLPVEIIFNGLSLVPILIAQMLIVSVTLYLNKLKKFTAAKYYLFITAILVTTCLLPFVPRETGNQYFLLAVALLPLFLFRDIKQILGGFIFTVIVYFVIDRTRDSIPDPFDIPPEILPFFSSVFILMVFIVLFISMYYFKNINADYERSLLKKTEELNLSQRIIAEKNKDITDSIHYARRIQSAILPQQAYIAQLLPQHFVLYKPKDIVAGDFYWVQRSGEYIFFAVADCTGHGVPGALVSVVCHDALNRSILEFDMKDPAEILNTTRDLVTALFGNSEENIRDGMDISLCVLHKPTGKLSWAGANSPLWIIRGKELIELKPDKQHIGLSDQMRPFQTFTPELQPNDSLYLFTDGYSDQFGGPQGKKFKKSRLKELLLSLSHEPMEKQQQLIEERFTQWKQGLEQIDDVCIMGVKVKE